MSLDPSANFTLVARQIIEEAFDICGVGSEGESINADMYARAMRSLNIIAKAWGAEEHLWLRTEKTVTLVEGQADYDLSPKPMRVIEARRSNIASSIEVPLMEWAYQQYTEQPNKTIQSIPTAFYYKPDKTTGTLYLWPTPSGPTAAQFEIKLTYLRAVQDFDGSNDPADFPAEWLRAITYTLAEELAIKYVPTNPALISRIEQRAAMHRADVESWDTEPASLFLQPEARR